MRMLPSPSCPLAGQSIFGQNVRCGSMTHLPSALSTEECHSIRSLFQVQWPDHRLAYTCLFRAGGVKVRILCASDALAIPVGCVDEIDSRIESLVDDPNRFVVVGITHAAEHHRAQAIRANLDAGSSKRAVLHIICSCRRIGDGCRNHHGIVTFSQRVNVPVGSSGPSSATRTTSREPSSTVSVPA